jgi:hypothetical protein
MTNAYKPSRRDFGKGVLALLGAAALKGCGSKDSDDSAPPAEPLPLSVLEQRINGTPVTNGQNVNLAMGERYGDTFPTENTTLLYVANKDVDGVAFEGILFGPEGHYESRMRTGVMNLRSGNGANLPTSFPLRLRKNTDGATLEWYLVKNAGQPNEIYEKITGNPITPTGNGTYDNELFVQEAVDRLDDRYKGSIKVGKNSDPGFAIVTSDAPSPLEGVAASALQTAWRSRVAGAGITNPVVNLANYSNQGGKQLRVLVGTNAGHPDIVSYLSAASITVPTDGGLVASVETPDYFGLVATGTTPEHVALAAEALQNPAAFSMTGSKKYKITGTAGNLTVTPQ